MQFRPQPILGICQSLDDIAFPTTTFTLENGLTVILAENHDVPLVSYQLIYQVGSKDEPTGKNGLSHLFEHLMFEGSAHAPGSFLVNMAHAGATNVNAFTSTDRTTYHATVPLGSLDYALFIESDRMGYFADSISQHSLDQERGVVLNEKLETEDGPYGKLYERKSLGCFPSGHPYAHTVIGAKEDITAVTLDDVKQWSRTYYTPSNAVLALCGDIDIARTREKVNHWFGSLSPGQPLSRAESWIADIPPQRRDHYQARVANGTLMLVWNIPPAGNTDTTLLSLIADYLASGLSSLLVKKLVYSEAIASSVQVQVVDGALCSQFILTATSVDGLPLVVLEQRLLDELRAFLSDGVKALRLSEVKNQIVNQFRDSYKTSAQIAALLSNSWATFGDAEACWSVLKQIEGATCEAIQHVAQRWLTRHHYTLEVIPFTARRDAHAIAADRHLPPSILAPVALSLPHIQNAVLDNGIRLVLLERHSQSDVYLDLLLPSLSLPYPGQHQLLIELLNEAGAGNRDAFEFSQSCSDLGSQMTLRRRLHHLSLLLSCRHAELAKSLELLCDRLQNSILREEDFTRQRALLQDALAEQQHVASAVVQRVLPGLMYPPGHPCRVAGGIEGTPTGLAATDLSALLQALPELLNTKDAIVIVTGDTTMQQLLPQLNASLGRLPGLQRRPAPHPEAKLPQHPRLFLLDVPNAEQTSIAAASLLPGVSSVDEAAFELLNTLFSSGFTSRINLNLREAKNWTYGVRGQLINDPVQRIHYVQTEVQADRTCEAIEELIMEYQALTGVRPVTAEELDEVRRTSLLGFSSNFESLSGLNNMISWLVRSTLPDDFWLHHQQRIAEIEVTEINALAQELFSIDRLTWVVAGDIRLFEKEIAALFPGQTEIITMNGDALYD